MSNLNTNLKRKFINSVGAVALFAAAAAPAAADSWKRGHGDGHGWKRDRTVVIHHRPQVVRKKVVHVYHHRPQPPARVVRVVRHHYYSPPPRRYYHTAGVNLSNQAGGVIIGAMLGAVTGAQFGKGSGHTAAVITGGILGAVIGGHIGQQMDQADHVHVQRTLEATPTGRSTSWVNPDNGANYTVTPTRTYRSTSSGYCREYNAWVTIDGYEQQAHGTACRMPDGTWQKVAG